MNNKQSFGVQMFLFALAMPVLQLNYSVGRAYRRVRVFCESMWHVRELPVGAALRTGWLVFKYTRKEW